MTPEVFEDLLSIVGPSLVKQNTTFRKAIEAPARLSLTIRCVSLYYMYMAFHIYREVQIYTDLNLKICFARYLATSDKVSSLSFSYRVVLTSARRKIKETCEGSHIVMHIAMFIFLYQTMCYLVS